MKKSVFEMNAAQRWIWEKNAIRTNDADAMYQIGQYEMRTDHSARKAVVWLQRAADLGHAEAMCELAFCFLVGHGIKKDRDKALEQYQSAAHLGNTKAMRSLGKIYEQGIFIKKDIQQAMAWYHKAADQEDTFAMRWLGSYYLNGIGEPADQQTGRQWFQKAASLGDFIALMYLELGCSDAIHTETEWGAVKRCKEIADSGNEVAMRLLGDCCMKYYQFIYLTEIYDTKTMMAMLSPNDPSERERRAVEWYQKSAGLGDPTALYDLGNCYQYGRGVTQDFHAAAAYYRKAAELGHTPAMYALGDLYQAGTGVEKEEHTAFAFYQEAAELGDVKAMRHLGFCYETGTGTQRDAEMAVAWYRKAVESEDAASMVYLGNCYKDGIGVEENIQTAIDWYQKATDSHDFVANTFLTALYEQGMIVQKREAEDMTPDPKRSALEAFFAERTEGEAESQPETGGENDTPAKEPQTEGDSEGMPCKNGGHAAPEEAAAEASACPEEQSSAARIRLLEEQVLRLKAENDAKAAAYQQERQIKEALMAENASLRKGNELWQDELRLILQKLETQVASIGDQTEKIGSDLRSIQKDTGEIREDVKGLVLSSSVRDDLVASVQKEMAALYTGIEGLTDQWEKERHFSARLNVISEGINTQINTSQELVGNEQKHLKALFGNGWDKLLPISQTSLISAGVLWKSCAGIEEESFDFSGICISVTSALEAEMKKYFFEDFQTYVKETYGAPSAQNWQQTFAVWPDILLSLSKVDFLNLRKKYEEGAVRTPPPSLSLRDPKYITLGALPYLFGVKVSRHLENNAAEKERYLSVLRTRMNEYLATILKDKTDPPIALFLNRRGNKNFIDRCEHVRCRYRNPSAHTDLISKDMARSCYQEVVGKIDAYEYSAHVTSLLLELISMVK